MNTVSIITATNSRNESPIVPLSARHRHEHPSSAPRVAITAKNISFVLARRPAEGVIFFDADPLSMHHNRVIHDRTYREHHRGEA